MATSFEWIKLILDRWTVILPICLFLGSATGLSFSMASNADLEAEKIKAIREVTEGFQAAMIENEPKEITVKSTCSPCGPYLNKHLKEYH